MNSSKQPPRHAAGLCAELGPEDGIDPRILMRARDRQRKPSTRKAFQLSHEAARLLSLILAGETADPLLRELRVLQVESADGGRRLCVTVAHNDPALISEADTLTALGRSHGRLRTELAHSIHRKRMPELKFRYVVLTQGG